MVRRDLLVRVGALAVACSAIGCSAQEHQLAADRAAKDALHARRPHVPEVHGSFDVDAADARALPAREIDEITLDLRGAICLAAEASREYRSQREAAYLTALAYTGTLHEYRANPRLGASGLLEASEDGGSASGGVDASVSRRLEQGGSFVLGLATDFLKNLRGDPLTTATSLLTSTLLLPLGRGGGVAAREALTQAERDVLYALRDFARYQQEFVVDVSTSYYRVLAQRDSVQNAEKNYENLLKTRDRAEDFGKAGRMPDFEVDQARQDLLRAEERRILARQAYEGALDAFKQELGLRTDAVVTLTDEPLDALRAAPPAAKEPEGAVEASIVTALDRRLDLLNARDQFDDSVRQVAVAADALGVQADLALLGTLSTPSSRPYDLRHASPSGSVGIDLDLPVDRVAERNAYRSAQVAALASRRSVEGLEDSIVASVRGAYRTLESARQSRRIQEEGVRLAERRVESATLFLEAGKATIRDRLEAEEALVDARNAFTQSLVSHEIARLELERDTGTLLPAKALECAGGGGGAGVAGASCPPRAAPPVAPVVRPGPPVPSAPAATRGS
jgi:outer membrane protein TolC